MSSVIRRRFVESSGRLPSGYTELDYIQSTGTQYINTGLNVNSSTGFYLDFINNSDLSSGSASWGDLIGGGYYYSSYWWTRFWLSTYSSSGQSGNITNGSNGSVNAQLTVGARMTASLINGAYTTSTGASSSITITYSSTYTTPLYLFTSYQYHKEGNINNCASMKLYEAKIYDGSTLVRDFVPCTNPSNVVGLYDLIDEQFYTDPNGNAFIAGDPV